MQNKIPLISIIVPYKNAAKNLKECVDSLLNQDFCKDNYEIIMVDNNSSDNGPDILKSYGQRIVLLQEKDGKGSCPARNTGISEAKAEILAFTDSDCVAEKNWISKIYEAFTPNIQVVAGEIYAYRPQTAVEKYYEKHMLQKTNLSYKSPYAVTANLAIKKSLFEKVGTFSTERPQTGDVEFSFRITSKGYNINYAKDAVVYHKNIATLRGLFKKIFFQGFYAPPLVKEYIDFLKEHDDFKIINLSHYRRLATNCAKLIIPTKNKKLHQELLFDTIYLLAKKSGMFCGCLRFGFIYL
jgi:glycosyltransferase involved in cell wall biosynthesis